MNFGLNICFEQFADEEGGFFFLPSLGVLSLRKWWRIILEIKFLAEYFKCLKKSQRRSFLNFMKATPGEEVLSWRCLFVYTDAYLWRYTHTPRMCMNAECKKWKQMEDFPVEFNTIICVFFYFLFSFCIKILLGIENGMLWRIALYVAEHDILTLEHCQ